MTGIRASEGRVPGSMVGGQKREVMWTDDKRHRGLGARIRRNTWTGRHVDLSGRVWWFERLLKCNHLLVAILCITQSVKMQTKCPCETCLKSEKKCSLKIFKESGVQWQLDPMIPFFSKSLAILVYTSVRQEKREGVRDHT